MRKSKYIYFSLLSLMFSFILLHNSTPHCHTEEQEHHHGHEHEQDHQHSWLGFLLYHHNHSIEADLQVKQFLPSAESQNQLGQQAVKKLTRHSLSSKTLQKRNFSWTLIQQIRDFEEPQLQRNLFLLQKIPWRGPPSFA